jgi:hypothetical protein
MVMCCFPTTGSRWDYVAVNTRIIYKYVSSGVVTSHLTLCLLGHLAVLPVTFLNGQLVWSRSRKDGCRYVAYTSVPWERRGAHSSRSLTGGERGEPVHGGTLFMHTFYGLFLCVFPRFAHVMQPNHPWVGGSFSPRLITNGVYSWVICPTDGQYGSVTSYWPHLQCRLIFLTLQIYSITRMAGLMSAIFGIILMNVRPVNCQVRAMLYLNPLWSELPSFKAFGLFASCE